MTSRSKKRDRPDDPIRGDIAESAPKRVAIRHTPALQENPVPEQFDCVTELNQAMEYLDKFGYVVLKNVLTQDEVNDGIARFWKWAEALGTGIKRGDPSTCNNDRWIPTFSNGIVSNPTTYVGHSSLLWTCRGNTRVQQVFRRVWSIHEDPNAKLITSFDGLGVYRPVTSKWKTTSEEWWHFDQNGFTKQGQHAVQGLVNFIDTTKPGDGGFACLPASHSRLFQDFFTEKEEDSGIPHQALRSSRVAKQNFVRVDTHMEVEDFWRWVQTKAPSPSWFTSLDNDQSSRFKYQPLRIGLPAGSLLLWDSRTLHCNVPATTPSSEEDIKQTKLRRLVAYVCMTAPSKVISDESEREKLLERRKQLFKEAATTNHWPHDPNKTSPPRYPLKRALPVAASTYAQLCEAGAVLDESKLTDSMKLVL